MKSNKTDNDLNFRPLCMEEALKPSNFCPPTIAGASINNNQVFLNFGNPSTKLSNPFNNAMDMAPLTPYPPNVSNIDLTEMNDTKTNDILNVLPDDYNSLEYPSELNSDDLYSYNKPRLNENYINSSINPLDIIRNFTFEDATISDNFRGNYTKNDIDEIFKKIESNNAVILSTMKAYRIPYPIAKLLIKNIIKLTLEYKGR